MKITLSVLGGIALTVVLMSLTTSQPQEGQNISRYHLVAYGNGLVYDSVTGKTIGLSGNNYKELRDGKTTLKQILGSVD